MIRKLVRLMLCILFSITIMAACASPTPTLTITPSPTEVVPVHPGTLAFSIVEPGYNLEIYLIQTDGTSLKQLTKTHCQASNPAWSPDGTRIAYNCNPDWNEPPEVWIMNADGSGQTELTHDKRGGIYAAWSPDGNQIAYSSWFYPVDVYGPAQIYVINTDGSNQRRVTNGPENDLFPQWTPDGKILFLRKEYYSSSAGNIYAINPDGSDLARLTTMEVGDFALSPDGTKLAIHDKGQRRIVILPVNATMSESSVTLVDTDFGYDFVQAAWSPDAQSLALARRDLTDIYGKDLYVVNADGIGLTMVPNAGYIQAVAWRPIISP